VHNIVTVTSNGFYYTFCAVVCILFVFLYDPFEKVAEATKTCRWIIYENYIFYLCTFVGLLHSTNIFTFSEPCIVTHKRERDQQDSHTFLINLFLLNYTPHVNKNPTRCNSMQIFIHCKVTLHVSVVTVPIIRSTKNCNRNLRYRS